MIWRINMKEELNKFFKSAFWLCIVLFILRCFFARESLINDFSLYAMFGYISEAIGVTVILTTIYERFLWRYNPLNKTPVLKRKYKGKLRSTYDGTTRDVKVEIKQTLLTIKIVLSTEESKSNSVTASITNIYCEKQLTYCYINTPNAFVRNRSNIHYGTVMMCVDDINNLYGQYYTDRKTTGDIELTPDDVK